MMVTNMTASRSPASEGNKVQEKLCSCRELPRQHQRGHGLWPEHPASGLCVGDRCAGRQQRKMGHGDCRQQDPGQNERAIRAAQQEMQRDRQREPGSELGGDRCSDEVMNVGERRCLIGDDLDRARDHQPPGRTEESPDHRIGHETDRRSGARKSKHAKQQPRERGRQRHGNEDRSEKIGVPGSGEMLGDDRYQGSQDDRDAAVRTGNGERKRTAQRHNGAADGGR